MPLFAQIIVGIALVVIVAEFYLVFRVRAERQILENIREASNE